MEGYELPRQPSDRYRENSQEKLYLVRMYFTYFCISWYIVPIEREQP